MSTIFALVAGYFVLLLLLSIAVRPKRQRLAVLANDLLSHDLSESQEHAVRQILETAYAVRAAPAVTLGTVVALLTPSVKFDRQAMAWAKENPEMVSDRRWGELFNAYHASIAAANPIFGVLLYIAHCLFKAKAYIFIASHYRQKKNEACDDGVKPKMTALEMFSELKAAA